MSAEHRTVAGVSVAPQHRPAVAAVACLVGAALADIVTTTVGLHIGLVEANPLMAAVFKSGLLSPAEAMLAVKLLAGAIALIPIFVYSRGRLRLLSPLLIASVWAFAAAWNTVLIVGVVA